MESLLYGVFKHGSDDVAKDRVGGRGRRKVGAGSHHLHVLHLFGDPSSSSETNSSVFVVIRA